MGRKKKQIVNLKPFCFYCDKEFNNELILHQHQKSRHFNCIKCKKRFSTAPALDTHYFHFHQEKLKNVPNAKRGRDTFDISIYGMDGVPIELIQYKLAEKVEKKRKKIYNEELKKLKEKNKNENDNNNNNAEIEKEKKEKKDKILKYLESKNDEIDKLLHSNNLTGQFYHNPNSINLTMKQKQMAQMYLNNNVNDNNSGKNNINNIINQINNNIQETNKSLNINNDNNIMDNNINDNNIDNNNNEKNNNNNDNNINDNIDINNINNNNIINKNNDYKMEEDNVD